MVPYQPAGDAAAQSGRIPHRRREHGSPAQPDGPDNEVGVLFTELRSALGLPADKLARLLATSPATIAALECGEITRLPAWPETERVVRAYTGLAGIDPGAMLQRIRARLDGVPAPGRQLHPLPAGPARTASPVKGAGVSARPAPATRKEPAETRPRLPRVALPRPLRLGRMSQRRAAITSAVGIAAAAFLAIGPLAEALPAPLQRAIGSLIGRVSWSTKTMPDGMPLIDPADPRSRRGDKLRTTGR